MKTTRKLNFSDTFRMARIINSAGITMPEIVELIDKYNGTSLGDIKDKAEKAKKVEELQTEAGMEMFGLIIDRVPNAETAINKFLGGLAGKKEAEIAEAPVTEIIELIKDIFATNEDIKGFFTSSLRSAKALPSTKS